jgi:hypothetical protein
MPSIMLLEVNFLNRSFAMDSNQPNQQSPTPRQARTRKLMETYLKFPPYVREAAVRNLAAQLDQAQPGMQLNPNDPPAEMNPGLAARLSAQHPGLAPNLEQPMGAQPLQ